MKGFINSIRQSVQTENWYAALAVALTVPDVCGWVEDPSLNSKVRYIKWYEKYLLSVNSMTLHGKVSVFLSGGDCYALRCAYLHEGANDISRQRARDVLKKFEFSTLGVHRVRINDVLILNVKMFCEEVVAAASKWMNDVAPDTVIQNRLAEFLTIKTTGFNPMPGVRIDP